jgi:hypothetical protein
VDLIHIDEKIPTVSLQELRESLIRRKVKRSDDAHGVSPYMLESLHESHSKFLLPLDNRSLSECFHPIAWKDTSVSRPIRDPSYYLTLSKK